MRDRGDKLLREIRTVRRAEGSTGTSQQRGMQKKNQWRRLTTREVVQKLHSFNSWWADKRGLPGPCFLRDRGKSAQAEPGSITSSKPITSSPYKGIRASPCPGTHGDCPSGKGQETQTCIGVPPQSQTWKEASSILRGAFLLQAAHLNRWGSSGLSTQRSSDCRKGWMNISWAPAAVNKSWGATDDCVAHFTLDNGCSALVNWNLLFRHRPVCPECRGEACASFLRALISQFDI